MATYLVTGGAGFIGSHLVDLLLNKGHGVRVLDNLSTGRREHLAAEAELIVGDIRDERMVAKSMGKADGCFHLAAIASVPACHEDPVGTHGVNQTGTLIVLEAARRAGGVPVVYASSAAVYGEAVECPISEGVVSSPLSTYGADKLACELHAAVMSRQHGVPTLGFRFFNVYGPRQDPNSPYSGVISIFCDRARRGYPIVIHGDGRQTRDFVHVSDVVRQLAEAIARIELSPDIFNLCSGTSTSVSELAQRITSALGVRPRIVHDQPRTGDIRASVGDPSRVRQTFGFLPRISLSEGLAGLVSARPRVA